MTGANRAVRAAEDAPEGVRRGLVIINTGDGKGKSTAAFGVMMRAWGRGMKVTAVQFIKQPKGQYGELMAAEKMGFEITPTGKGFTWESENLSDDASASRAGWKMASGPRDKTGVSIADRNSADSIHLSLFSASTASLSSTMCVRIRVSSTLSIGLNEPQPPAPVRDLLAVGRPTRVTATGTRLRYPREPAAIDVDYVDLAGFVSIIARKSDPRPIGRPVRLCNVPQSGSQASLLRAIGIDDVQHP